MAAADVHGEREIDRSDVIGTTVGGYRIERQLAEGGMGTVYIGRHTVLARRVAIKVLHSELVSITAAREGLFREARLLDEMPDPCVARVYDAGVLPDGRPWIAMELLGGECLADRLSIRTRLGLRETASLVGAIVDALAIAHARGVVHSDVKPENVMVCKGPTGLVAKMVDWGIASSLKDDSPVPHPPMGTPQYMAPEQVRGERLDERTDIYALGALVYELLMGHPPFLGESAEEIAEHQLWTPPQPLRVQRPEVPPAIESLVLQMLAKSAADRPTLDTIRRCFALVEEAQSGLLTDRPATCSMVARLKSELDGVARARPVEDDFASRATMRFGVAITSAGRERAVASGTIYPQPKG